MLVQKYVRQRKAGDLIVEEYDVEFCRASGVMRSGSGVVLANSVVGQQDVGTLSGAFAALGTNAGNPTCGSIAVAAGTEEGEFDLVMTDATHFTVLQPPGPAEDAPGQEVGHGVFGAAFNAGGLSFTMTAGGTPCVDGDAFSITVSATAGDGKFSLVNASATDGSQIAAGISTFAVNTSAGDDPFVYLARGPLTVRAQELVWPSGATTNQIAAWTAQLAALNINVTADVG